MLGTIYAAVVLCSKIYRIGILMYGKASDSAGDCEVVKVQLKKKHSAVSRSAISQTTA